MTGGPTTKPSAALGFLTVLEDDELGIFGGYLLVNSTGRPLEFHCTAPVKPNRAQEILYGPTLRPYLYGEQIGATLLEQTKQPPPLVLTDSTPALAVRAHVQTPVALIALGDSPGTALRIADGNDASLVDGDGTDPARVGPYSVVVHNAHASDLSAVEELIGGSCAIDLLEPFERIRAAICEAQRIGGSAPRGALRIA
ncbi:MAG: hypothetical protein WDZ59_04345 [Pirellulales bacterium]